MNWVTVLKHLRGKMGRIINWPDNMPLPTILNYPSKITPQEAVVLAGKLLKKPCLIKIEDWTEGMSL